MYICEKCGKEVSVKELESMPGLLRCPNCGHHVFIKKRPPITKKVKAV